MIDVAEVLNGAADLIERDGWRQGPSVGDGRVCAGVAIIRTTRSNRLSQQAMERLRQVTGDNPVHWNDAPGRTKGEVVVALRTAAERAA